MSNDRPARSTRPSGGGRSGAPSGSGRSAGGRPKGGSAGRSGSGSARSGGRSGGGQSGRGRDDRRQERPLTAAEKRALEVKLRRMPRAPRDPDIERQRIEERSLEVWIDDGSVRNEAVQATGRASSQPAVAPVPAKRRPPKPLDPEIEAELVGSLGKQRGARLSERLAQASEALDRERFQEARRIAGAIAKEAPDVAMAHEVLGLACYRLGLYKPAVRSLEMALDLRPEPTIMPVVADCYRALGRWSSVDRVWREIKELSPSHEVLAEGRIIAASALADQGDLPGAIALMAPATKRVKVVREHHLRQWYVLADLYDRVGDAVSARRWFAMIAEIDPEFADVDQRLRTIGR